MTRAARTYVIAAVVAALVLAARPAPASAFSAGSVVCSLTGLVSGALGKVCNVARHAGTAVKAGEKLVGGHLGAAVNVVTGVGGQHKAAALVGLAALTTAVLAGARYALRETVHVIGVATRPNLQSTWFSSSYWRMASVAVLLTLPFLFAAAVQATLHADLAMMLRAAFGYLPLATLGIAIAAPVTMMLLAGSDEMSSLVSSAADGPSANALVGAGALSGVAALGGHSVFLAFFVGLATAAVTLSLWVELLVREAAVYVIVFMLPLFFAAMVWPARRVWAVRTIELLIALILSKFAIVAVLALGGVAMGHSLLPGPTAYLVGLTLVTIAAFSPWALMRLLPLHELAGAAMAGLSSGGIERMLPSVRRSDDAAADSGSVASSDAPDPGRAAATRAVAGAPPEPPEPVDAPTSPDPAPRPSPVAAPGSPLDPATAAPAPPAAGTDPSGEPGTAPFVSTGDSAAAAAESEPPAPRERLPGLPARFQAADGEWEPLYFSRESFPDVSTPLLPDPAPGLPEDEEPS